VRRSFCARHSVASRRRCPSSRTPSAKTPRDVGTTRAAQMEAQQVSLGTRARPLRHHVRKPSARLTQVTQRI
jgi:hypothetical protein